jgi:hypothetical protein
MFQECKIEGNSALGRRKKNIDFMAPTSSRP